MLMIYHSSSRLLIKQHVNANTCTGVLNAHFYARAKAAACFVHPQRYDIAGSALQILHKDCVQQREQCMPGRVGQSVCLQAQGESMWRQHTLCLLQ